MENGLHVSNRSLMAESTYQVTDRRPIAARNLGFFQRLAPKLARAGISANSISIASALFGVAAGAALYCTRITPHPAVRLLWLASASFIQLRLVANLLDGMVAVSSGKASAVGELYNELPDRISDAATLAGLGYAVGAIPVLGWIAAILAIITAYIRTLGKSVGAGSDFSGPMAKQQRMFIVTTICIFCACVPQSWQQWQPANVALVIVILGSVITSCRRLSHIAKNLKGAE
jgi:phosphatidylglycerophosphate synthase